MALWAGVSAVPPPGRAGRLLISPAQAGREVQERGYQADSIFFPPFLPFVPQSLTKLGQLEQCLPPSSQPLCSNTAVLLNQRGGRLFQLRATSQNVSPLTPPLPTGQPFPPLGLSPSRRQGKQLLLLLFLLEARGRGQQFFNWQL